MTAIGVSIPFYVRGELLDDPVVAFEPRDGAPFATPCLDLDSLVWPRTQPLPLAEVPVAEIIEVLAATGERLHDDRDGLLTDAVDSLSRTSPYERRILENSYGTLWQSFQADYLRATLIGELGGAAVLDGWCRNEGVDGRGGYVRAYPTRLVHILAGNSPGVAAYTVVKGALMKGAHLLKLPSNDLLTATAILRTLAAVAPGHPVAQSFAAVYWRGGDESVESVLYRPQFFDKLVAWGGEAAIQSAVQYLGPGFELIAFDPKNSISMVGREAFSSDSKLREVAALAATDATSHNQEACTSSRFQYVEGSLEEVDLYCELLQAELGLERPSSSAVVAPPPAALREEVEAMRLMDALYRVFGATDGRGLVVRSTVPVGFFPSNKTVNVVAVDSLADAVKFVTISTQTVGIYPAERKRELRDSLAAAGVQRVVNLGGGGGAGLIGLAHDGFFPMHRFVRWVNDED